MNEIPGSCRHGNNCTFRYAAERTPNLTSISPSSGPGGPSGIGTVITLLGTGFSTVNEENSVQIGGATCVVLNSTSDNITCRAGELSFSTLVLPSDKDRFIIFTTTAEIHARSLANFCSQFAFVTRRPYCPGRPKKLCFTTQSLAVKTVGARLCVVKQSFFGLQGQYGRRVTKANMQTDT